MSHYLDFVITGHGRSGTKWLAELLNKDPNARVHHELLGSADKQRYRNVYYGRMTGDEFLKLREPEIQKIHETGVILGDVNSHLRFVTKELSKMTTVIGLVRNGWQVVDSLYRCKCFQLANYPPFEPPPELETVWEKCCWYWADTYSWIEDEHVERFFRFEDLHTDWSTFVDLLYLTDVRVALYDWQTYKNKVINTAGGPAHSIGKFEREAFESLCGDTMRRFGYE